MKFILRVIYQDYLLVFQLMNSLLKLPLISHFPLKNVVTKIIFNSNDATTTLNQIIWIYP